MKRQPRVGVHYEQVNITSNLRWIVAAGSGTYSTSHSEPTMCGCPALRMFSISSSVSSRTRSTGTTVSE